MTLNGKLCQLVAFLSLLTFPSSRLPFAIRAKLLVRSRDSRLEMLFGVRCISPLFAHRVISLRGAVLISVLARRSLGVAKGLNLEPLAATYLQRRSVGGCHDPLAQDDGR